MSTDVLWSKYRTLQPYQYAANNPVMAVDRTGLYIVGLRAEDRSYLATSMKSHFGVDVSFNERASMVISTEQLEKAKQINDPESYAQLVSISEMAHDVNKVLNIAAIEGILDDVRGLSIGGNDLNGNIASQIRTGVVTGIDASEVFVSHTERPNNAWIVIRPDLTKDQTFSAEGNKQTKTCGTCVLVHALLDHALPWFGSGASRTRPEGVTNHNTALVNKVDSAPRDGKDHTDDGSQR